MLFSVLAETQSRVGRFYRITITQPGRPYYSRRNMNKRIALVSEHASPLAAIGGADTGGQNIAVAELAQHLAIVDGQIDILINNAGTDMTLPLEDLTIADWDRVLDVNLRGPFYPVGSRLSVSKAPR